MIIRTAVAGAALALALTPALAAAQDAGQERSPIYGTLGYSQGRADGVDTGAVQARLGVRMHRFLGAEVELAQGVDDDHTYIGGVRSAAKLQHHAGAYAVGFIPLSPNLELFARAGYGGTAMKYETDQGGYVGSADGASWNYGAGAQFLFDDANGVRLDYTRKEYLHDRGEADEVSVAYVRRF